MARPEASTTRCPPAMRRLAVEGTALSVPQAALLNPPSGTVGHRRASSGIVGHPTCPFLHPTRVNRAGPALLHVLLGEPFPTGRGHRSHQSVCAIDVSVPLPGSTCPSLCQAPREVWAIMARPEASTTRCPPAMRRLVVEGTALSVPRAALKSPVGHRRAPSGTVGHRRAPSGTVGHPTCPSLRPTRVNQAGPALLHVVLGEPFPTGRGHRSLPCAVPGGITRPFPRR